MLALLRIMFGFALFAVFARAVGVAEADPWTEGTTDGGYVALAVAIGMLNAVVWAPAVGGWMADPLTGAFTAGNPADFTNHLLQFAHKLALRRWRRCALFFAFLEGVRHPDLPGAFVLGLQHARPGSWLEKVFAREVWRFDNAENCLRAWKVLAARGASPNLLHRRAEVNLLIQSQQRPVPLPRVPLAVPPGPPAPAPKRNPAIRLFEGVPAGGEGEGAVPMGTVPPPPCDLAPGRVASPPGAPIPVVGWASPSDAASEPTAAPVPAAPPGGGSGPGSPEVPARLGFRDRLRVLITGRPPT